MKKELLHVTRIFDGLNYCFGCTETGTAVLIHKRTLANPDEFKTLQVGSTIKAQVVETKPGTFGAAFTELCTEVL
ncbi:MAG: hypothetical protein IT366_19530 [Candidatus Hydrogenedentes bacterium]|nr:hypothetical protein [Candidatus Hydrogenedentota bacterium]